MQKKPKILYIEDNPDNYKLVEMLLLNQGFDIKWAKTGLEGLKLTNSYKPNLILMDLNLPDLSGSTVTTKLRSMKESAALPIIAVSANTTEESKEEAIVAGCNGFIEKPINIKTFVSQLLAYLQGFRVKLKDRNEKESLIRYNKSIVENLENKVRELTNTKNQLEESKRNLERKVEERTKKLKESYEKLKEIKIQFIQAEKMSALGQLVAGIAHEINNPISYVINNFEILAEDFLLIKPIIELFIQCRTSEKGLDREEYSKEFSDIDQISEKINITPSELPEEVQDLIDSSKKGLERVKTIVQELRNFSRLDKSKATAVDINNAIETALRFLHYQIGKNISISKQLAENSIIDGNFQALVQVFMNVLSNAVYAINKDKDKGEIVITTRKIADRLVVQFANDGPPIEPRFKDKIFDPFFTTKPPGEGTGLGLSVTYSILKAHKAETMIISPLPNSDTGVLFRIIFPTQYADEMRKQ